MFLSLCKTRHLHLQWGKHGKCDLLSICIGLIFARATRECPDILSPFPPAKVGPKGPVHLYGRAGNFQWGLSPVTKFDVLRIILFFIPDSPLLCILRIIQNGRSLNGCLIHLSCLWTIYWDPNKCGTAVKCQYTFIYVSSVLTMVQHHLTHGQHCKALPNNYLDIGKHSRI